MKRGRHPDKTGLWTCFRSLCLLALLTPAPAFPAALEADLGSDLGPATLRCEYRPDPAGIDETAPRLSWTLLGGGRARGQSAYQVRVAHSLEELHSREKIPWDSGKVQGSASVHVEYDGAPLESNTTYFWSVRIWDLEHRPSAWSSPARWTTGLFEKEDWKAQWVSHDRHLEEIQGEKGLLPAAYFRKEFNTGKPVARAILYITARGLFQGRLNGERIGRDSFTPGWSSYTRRLYYLTYDVTTHLKKGVNTMGAILATGWYSGHIGTHVPDKIQKASYGSRPALLAQLMITYEDGDTDVIATDSTWKSTTGPTLEADILMGETYDARLEMPGWSRSGFEDGKWKAAVTGIASGTSLEAYPGDPVRAVEELKPVWVSSPAAGVHIFDMGVNFAGRARLSVTGSPGQTVTMRFGEKLDPGGTLMTRNLRGARATDTYILKGGGRETWEPQFTYHGFRYVEARGLRDDQVPGSVTGIVMSSPLPVTGRFNASAPLLNRLAGALHRSQLSNYFEIPTDCPQRDERLGWSGDVQLFAQTASYRAGIAPFLAKWLQALADDQLPDGAYPDFAPSVISYQEPSPGWGDAGIIVPHLLYRMYGDTRIIRDQYPSMKRFMVYLESRSRQNLLPAAPTSYGDWMAPDKRTPRGLIATAYFAHDAKLMAEMAGVIGENGDARHYELLYERIRRSFLKAYVSESGIVSGDTQTGYSLVLAMGLAHERDRNKIAERLYQRIASNSWRLTTGYIGTRYLLPALSGSGKPGIALRIMMNRGYPSWGFMLDNGATTLWERWDGDSVRRGMPDPDNTSLNHCALGSAGYWLYSDLAGIRPGSPGFKEIVINPTIFPDSINRVESSYRSVHGVIRNFWYAEGSTLRMDIAIPHNTTATVHIPWAIPDEITESGDPLEKAAGITAVTASGRETIVNLGSGKYRFKSPLPAKEENEVPDEGEMTDIDHIQEVPWL